MLKCPSALPYNNSRKHCNDTDKTKSQGLAPVADFSTSSGTLKKPTSFATLFNVTQLSPTFS